MPIDALTIIASLAAPRFRIREGIEVRVPLYRHSAPTFNSGPQNLLINGCCAWIDMHQEKLHTLAYRMEQYKQRLTIALQRMKSVTSAFFPIPPMADGHVV